MKWRILTNGRVFRLESQDIDGHPFVEAGNGRNFHTLGEAIAYRDRIMEDVRHDRGWHVVDEIDEATHGPVT